MHQENLKIMDVKFKLNIVSNVQEDKGKKILNKFTFDALLKKNKNKVVPMAPSSGIVYAQPNIDKVTTKYINKLGIC